MELDNYSPRKYLKAQDDIPRYDSWRNSRYHIQFSDIGWMQPNLLDLWFRKQLKCYTLASRPLLLLVDGHSSDYWTSSRKWYHHPPNTTHPTQPWPFHDTLEEFAMIFKSAFQFCTYYSCGRLSLGSCEAAAYNYQGNEYWTWHACELYMIAAVDLKRPLLVIIRRRKHHFGTMLLQMSNCPVSTEILRHITDSPEGN